MKTEIREKIAEIFEKTEDKNVAVQQAVDLIVDNKFGDLIAQLREENEKFEMDREYRSAMGTRILSAEEQKFYQAVATSSITIGGQDDVIPTSIIDRTLAGIRLPELQADCGQRGEGRLYVSGPFRRQQLLLR